MRDFLNGLWAVVLLILMTLASFLLAGMIVVGGIFVLMIPRKSWHRRAMRALQTIPTLWVSVNNLLIRARPCVWDIEGNASLSKEQWYLLIANHQTWLDILVLGYAFNRKIPLLKFFMKKELLWTLPIMGVACWMLDYPFMYRHSREAIRKKPELKMKDIETARSAAQKFLELPTTVMNFVEGTRFTQEKHQKQRSPFNHLLKPKAAGAAVIIKELRRHLSGILNVTIHYSDPDLTFFKFFRKGCRKITIRYELLPVTPDLIGDYYADRKFRVYFQNWLNARWQEKDTLLNELKNQS